jgi:hypothetical protein
MKEDKKILQLNTVENAIKHRIFIIRGQKVMLDYDLAELYQVETKVLNQAVKRNDSRFPEDFLFKLTEDEFESLQSIITPLENPLGKRSQIVTSSVRSKYVFHLPHAFTEHGIAMLSSVLNSEIAVQMNIFIIRAFIKMRESLETYKDLAIKIDKIEIAQLHDQAMLKNVHEVVKQLLEKPRKSKKK